MATPVQAHGVMTREELVRALAATLFGVVQRMKQDSARKAAEWDLSVTQVRALYALREPASMRELADRLYLDPSNLTALVDRLEALGLVDRTADADDRRVKRLVITKKGSELADRLYLDPSNLTALVDRLEGLGLVERTADAEDRRVKRLVITKKGSALADEVIGAVFGQQTLMSVLDDDEQHALLDLLTRLLDSPEP